MSSLTGQINDKENAIIWGISFLVLIRQFIIFLEIGSHWEKHWNQLKHKGDETIKSIAKERMIY